MKLKAPKTWQLIVILITVFVLAIGGSLLAVYFTTGFEAPVIPPNEIVVEDADATYNALSGQYETGRAFKLKITSPTEGVTEQEITLGFKSGVSVSRSEGKISDKTIIVPERVRLNEEFEVQLVQETYTSKSGETFTSNKGGISELVILTQNNQLGSTTIKIAVDVPVRDIGLEIVDATTGAVLGNETDPCRIAEGTHFALRPKFYPQESRYLFSDDKNAAISQKREKDVFYDVAPSSQGIKFEFNNFDPYFVAGDQTSENNQISAYAFSSAKEQLAFYSTNSQIEGQPLYSEAIRQLTLPGVNSITSKIFVNVVEANVGSFKIDTTTAENPIGFTTNQLFKLSARTSSLADRNLNINISDIHGQSLLAMIKNVGMRVVEVTDAVSGEKRDASLVVIKGGKSVSVVGNEYVLINDQVKNLSHAYWELSTNGEYLIQTEIVLFVEDEKGQTQIFVPEGENYQPKYVFFETAEGQDNPVDWKNGVGNQLSIMLIYDAQGKPIVSEFSKDLASLTNVPEDNVYQKTIFFAYYDAAFGEGESMADYVDIDTVGQGNYNIPGLGNRQLFPLRGSALVAKDALNFNLIFATVRTDAYGNPIMEGRSTFVVQKWSRAISVQVEKTLQGFDECSLQIDTSLLTAQNFFAIPTQTELGLNLVLKLKKGDQSIFQQELANKRISFYASEDAKGEKVNNDIFIFGEPEYAQDGVTVTIPFAVRNVKIEDVRGKDFWVRIDYNNSVTTNSWTAEPGNKEYAGALKIYNQNPASISNDILAGKTFDIQNVLKADGKSEITISGNGQTTDLTIFNSYIKQTVVKDAYGRAFQSGIILSSDNPAAIGVNNETGTISPLNAKADGVKITVKAGDISFAFTLNVDSVGVTDVKVKGISQGTSPKAQIEGEPGEEVFLKKTNDHDGFLEVFVQGAIGNETYSADAYTITISPTFLAGLGQDSKLWEMLKINGGSLQPSSELAIEKIQIVKHFGSDVTIPFVARNDNGTLDFVFELKITETATFKSQTLNQVDYDGIIGVRSEDKPEGATNEQIFVYAEFGIDLNTYFKVENVDWANAYGAAKDIVVNGQTVGQIESGVLKFMDVFEPTTFNIRFFAVDGNNYGFNQELEITVVPNIQVSANADKPLQLSDLYADQEPNISQYITLRRIAGDSAIPAFEYVIEDEKKQNSQGENVRYVVVDGQGKVAFNATLNLEYGDEARKNKLSLIHENKVVKTCDIHISVGLTQESLAACGSWLNNFVTYGENRMLLVSQTSLDFIQHKFACKLKAEVLSNNDAYSVGGSGAERRLNFTFKGEAVKVGEKYYLAIGFMNENTIVATIKVPIILSAVGDKFASAGTGEAEDVKAVLEGKASAIASAGTSYNLFAPKTIEGKDYTFIFEGGSVKLALLDEEITSTKEVDGLKINVGGVDYNYQISDGRIIAFGTNIGLNIGEGGVLEIGSEKYIVRNIDNEIIKISKLTIVEGKNYETASTPFGIVLTEFDGTKYLTGFKEGEAQVRFEVPNAYKNIISIIGNELKINHVVGEETESVVAKFRIVQGETLPLTYDFALSIAPDASIAAPVYPFNGNTELLEIPNGEEKTIDMKTPLGADSLHNGEPRFSDKITINGEEQDIETNLGLSIKEVLIDGQKVEPTNGVFDVRIDGQKVIFENKANAQDVSVIVQRTYEGIFLGYDKSGSENEYTYNFTINQSGEQSYFVKFSGQNSGNLNDKTWALANNREAQTLTVTTFWQSENGQGEVGKDVTTTATNDFGEGFEVEFNNKQLSITIEGFVPEEATKHVYFSVNGIKVGELTVVIPATVEVTFINELNANREYEASDIVTSLTERYDITKVETIGDASKFAKVEGTNLTFGHLVEDKEITLKFTYSNETNNGVVQKTFKVNKNLNFKDLISISEENTVTAGESLVVTTSQYLDNVILSLKGFEVKAVRKAGFSFEAIETVSINDKGNVTIKTNFVAEQQTAQFILHFTYNFNNQVGFTKDVEVHLPIKPAVQMKVNYPAPAGTELAYETIKSEVPINNFFNAPAMFANKKRIELVGEEENATIDTSDADLFQVTGKILKNGAWEENKDLDVSWAADGGLTVILPSGLNAARVKLQITYKGVLVEYDLYVTTSNVIGSQVNPTTNRDGDTETIYPDTMGTKTLFSTNRLFEIKVDLTAQADQVVYAFVADVKEGVAIVNKDANSKAKFKLSDIRAGIRYVDCGDDKGINLKENQTIVFKTADKFDAPNAPGLTFQRMAKRVEFTYTLADNPNGLVITDERLKVIGDEFAWDKDSEDNETNNATAKINCKYTDSGSKIFETDISYKLKRALDIAAGNAFDSISKTIEIPNGMIIPEIETTWLNHYRLVDLAKLSHPSTGLALSDKTIGKDVGLTINVVSGEHTIKIGNKEYHTVFQNGGKDYLTFTPITDAQDSTKVYDYYLFGEGCSNAGDYVLVKIDYTSNDVTQTYYLPIKLVPGYNVTINGQSVAVAGETTNGAVGNSASPYNFTPGDNKTIEFSKETTSVLSVVREHWNTSNIANALTYVMRLGAPGQDINIDMKKLGYSDTADWTLPQTGGKITLEPQTVVFGEKKYKVDIEDSYGYKIEFFFNLVPANANTPVVDSSSVTSMIEGQPFDIGVVYDKVVMADEGKDKLPITNREQKPASTEINVINLRNINAWGSSAEKDAFAALLAEHGENATPVFHYVTIQDIHFVYNKAISVSKNGSLIDGHLATASDLKYPGSKKEDGTFVECTGRDVGKELTVPTMPGWIYGTNDSTQVDVVITLKYYEEETHINEEGSSEKTINEETCTITHTIQLTRKASFSETKSVVVDSVGFNPYEYIKASNRISTNDTENDNFNDGKTLYHDTLEVYLPANNGNVNFDVEFYRDGAKIATANRHPSNSLSRPVTEYYSLSALFEESLPSEVENRNFANVSFKIVVKEHSGSEAVTEGEEQKPDTRPQFRYAGSELTEQAYAKEGNKAALNTLTMVASDDTLYIEDAGLMSTGKDTIPRTRYYLIKVGDETVGYETYRYTHEFDLARRWTELEAGLGQNTAKELNGTWTRESDGKYKNGYKVDISKWAGEIKDKYGAVTVKTLANKGDASESVSLAGQNVDLSALRFEVGDKDSTAKFDGTTLYTGANYKLNNQEYILINIYVKASGGPFAGNDAWKASNSNSDKLLGQFRIFLTGKDATSTGV